MTTISNQNYAYQPAPAFGAKISISSKDKRAMLQLIESEMKYIPEETRINSYGKKKGRNSRILKYFVSTLQETTRDIKSYIIKFTKNEKGKVEMQLVEALDKRGKKTGNLYRLKDSYTGDCMHLLPISRFDKGKPGSYAAGYAICHASDILNLGGKGLTKDNPFHVLIEGGDIKNQGINKLLGYRKKHRK